MRPNSLLATVCLICAPPGIAKELAIGDRELSLLGGIANANDLSNDTDERNIVFDDDRAFMITLNWPQIIDMEANTQYEFLFAQSRVGVVSELENQDNFTQMLEIFHLHAGGTYEWNESDFFSPYVGGGFGLSHYEPDATPSDTRISLNGAAGVKLRLGKNFGLRIDARFFATFIDGDASIFCGGEFCDFTIVSDLWIQQQITGGLMLRF